MSCRSLADTGPGAPVVVVLALAGAFLLVGLACLLRAQSGSRPAALLLAVLLVGGGLAVGLVPSPSASAAPTRCSDGADPVRIAQSEVTRTASGAGAEEGAEEEDESEGESPLTFTEMSDLDGLAPGVAPAPIAGVVVNNGPDDVYIGAITVDIVDVVPASGAAAGRCDASDYVLQDPRMVVGRAVPSNGGRATYAGAALGFTNKSTNQDACQGATVQLRYRTSD